MRAASTGDHKDMMEPQTNRHETYFVSTFRPSTDRYLDTSTQVQGTHVPDHWYNIRAIQCMYTTIPPILKKGTPQDYVYEE